MIPINQNNRRLHKVSGTLSKPRFFLANDLFANPYVYFLYKNLEIEGYVLISIYMCICDVFFYLGASTLKLILSGSHLGQVIVLQVHVMTLDPRGSQTPTTV